MNDAEKRLTYFSGNYKTGTMDRPDSMVDFYYESSQIVYDVQEILDKLASLQQRQAEEK